MSPQRSTFSHFSTLPAELRIDIWQAALEAESQNRIVLMNQNDQRIHPTIHLKPPFLSVNVECRREALAFYSTTVEVFRGESEETRESKGYLYLNFEKNKFMVGNGMRNLLKASYWKEDWRKPTEDSSSPLYIVLNHYTSWISDHDCHKINKIVNITCNTNDFDAPDEWGIMPSYPHEDLPDVALPTLNRYLFPEAVSTTCEILIISTLTYNDRKLLHDISRLSGEDFMDEWSSRIETYDFLEEEQYEDEYEDEDEEEDEDEY